MLGNDIYDLDWWFYVIWNRFLALNRQILHLRSWKMLRIIINRMSPVVVLWGINLSNVNFPEKLCSCDVGTEFSIIAHYAK